MEMAWLMASEVPPRPPIELIGRWCSLTKNSVPVGTPSGASIHRGWAPSASVTRSI